MISPRLRNVGDLADGSLGGTPFKRSGGRGAWRKIGAFVACLAATVAPAAAQDAIVALDTTLMAGWSGNNPVGNSSRRHVGRTITQRRPAPRVNPAQVIARTAYRPDPAVRARVYARAVQTMAKASPGEAAKFRQILVSGKMRNEVAGFLARYGMSPNNLVDTTAIYLAVAWLTTHRNNGAPSAEQLRGLRRQVALAYGSVPQIMAMSNAAKQELAEANLLQASLSSTLADQASKDPATLAKARAAIASWVRDSYQLELTRMTLTANGLQ